VRFGVDRLGQWTPTHRFEVTRDQLRGYAAATNEVAADLLWGEVASPVFAIVPVWDTIHAATAPVVPPEARPHVLHVGQEFVFHRPIVGGSEVTARSTVVGVTLKSSGTAVLIRAELREGSRLLVEQFITEFYRGVYADVGGGQVPAEHRLPEGLGEPHALVSERVDEDQTWRYSQASGDRLAIHLDDGAAQAVGLPGIIVHGLCLMAFAARAVLPVLDA
jgi:acyl dehydratase